MTSPSPLDRLAGPGNVLAKELRRPGPFGSGAVEGCGERRELAGQPVRSCSGAHALCLAALRHHGFRPSKRYISLGGSDMARTPFIGVLVLFLVAFQIVPIGHLRAQ